MSAVESVRKLFHLVAAAVLVFSIYYDLFVLTVPKDHVRESVAFAGRWKYLTFITAVFHMTYYVLSTVDDLFSKKAGNGNGGKLWKFRNYMFSSIVFPLGMFVACSFWTLFNINRELIFPESLDAWFPSWLNHALHTLIVPLDVIEVFLIPHIYPKRKTGFSVLATIIAAYTVWVLFIAFHTHFWVYPVLAVLNWTNRALFFIGCMLLTFVFYVLGEFVNTLVWGKVGDSSEVKTKSKPAKGLQRQRPKAN